MTRNLHPRALVLCSLLLMSCRHAAREDSTRDGGEGQEDIDTWTTGDSDSDLDTSTVWTLDSDSHAARETDMDAGSDTMSDTTEDTSGILDSETLENDEDAGPDTDADTAEPEDSSSNTLGDTESFDTDSETGFPMDTETDTERGLDTETSLDTGLDSATGNDTEVGTDTGTDTDTSTSTSTDDFDDTSTGTGADTGTGTAGVDWIEDCIPPPFPAERRYPGACVEEKHLSNRCLADQRFISTYDDEERKTLHESDFDGNGQSDVKVAYLYDGAGRLVATETDGSWPSDPADQVTDIRATKEYDANGRLVLEQTDGPPMDGVADSESSYSYDEDGRREWYAYDGSPMDGEPDYYRHYVYDDDGNLTKMWYDDAPADGLEDATQTFEYDLDGHLVREEIDHRPADGIPEHVNVYAYENGRLVSTRKDDIDGSPQCFYYVYDGEGRKIEELYDDLCAAGPQSYTMTFTYDENGRLETQSHSSGWEYEYRYDESGRTIWQRYCHQDCVVKEWGFDGFGNPIFEVEIVWPYSVEADAYVASFKRSYFDCWI